MGLSDDFSERRPYNAVTDFVDANVARGLGNKIAFIDPDRSLTYGDLQTRSIRFANALRALGIAQEQRVALLLHDTVDYPVAFWGTMRAGRIAHPAQYLSQRAAIRLYPRRQPRHRAGRRGAAGAGDLADHRAASAPENRDPGRRHRRRQSGIPRPRRASVRGRHRRRRRHAVHRRHGVRRSGVLALHLGLDRRSQGRQARPFQSDGDGETVRPRRARHHRERRRPFGGEIVLRLRARQRHDLSVVGRRHRRAVARSGRRRNRCSR